MTNKKADLSLSTNAIVILIIAITILGLALGFTRGIFSSLGEKIETIGGQTMIENPATLDKPITFTNDKVEVRKGQSFDLGVSIFNRFSEAYNYALSYTCVDEDGNDATDGFKFVRPAGKDINVNEHVEYSTTMKILSTTTSGIYSCTITADTGSEEDGILVMEQKDVTIIVT